MLIFDISARFTKPGYIAHPYWPEMNHIIEIQKKSGMNRAKSDANRRKALEEYLKNNAMTLADYEQIEKLAQRPFHTDPVGNIVIPSEKVSAFLVNTTDELRSASRPCEPDQIRTRIRVSFWATGKNTPDGIWERFAVVESGGGLKLSNQRGLRRSFYIQNFTATGTIEINPEFVKPDVLERAIKWGGENIGIGAARKMGWGRFTLEKFEEALK